MKIIYPSRTAIAFPLLPSSQKGRTAGPFGNRPGAADGGDIPRRDPGQRQNPSFPDAPRSPPGGTSIPQPTSREEAAARPAQATRGTPKDQPAGGGASPVFGSPVFGGMLFSAQPRGGRWCRLRWSPGAGLQEWRTAPGFSAVRSCSLAGT